MVQTKLMLQYLTKLKDLDRRIPDLTYYIEGSDLGEYDIHIADLDALQMVYKIAEGNDVIERELDSIDPIYSPLRNEAPDPHRTLDELSLVLQLLKDFSTVVKTRITDTYQHLNANDATAYEQQLHRQLTDYFTSVIRQTSIAVYALRHHLLASRLQAHATLT